MKSRELILVSIIIGYLLTIFSIVVNEHEIENQNYEPRPIQMVELYSNGTARNYEIENTSEPNLFTSIAETMSQFAFALPFVLGGIGMWGMSLAMLNAPIPISSESLNQWLLFLIPSLISIPATIILSTKIPIWRRIPYIYVFAMLISGTPILLSSTFGQ